MARKLYLRKEHLAELTGAELTSVAGGQVSLLCIPTQYNCTGYYPSLNAPCRTLNDCIQTG
ncbi:MAG TPA: hypothetical protein VFQ85_05460 [Mycobacteriales bacterium]|jgi:hypothetical protein|nr:hypothetical protein [Mycobacteriales bacterium]